MSEQALSPSQGHQPVGRRQAHYHQQYHYDPAYKRDHLQRDEHECSKAMSARSVDHRLNHYRTRISRAGDASLKKYLRDLVVAHVILGDRIHNHFTSRVRDHDPWGETRTSRWRSERTRRKFLLRSVPSKTYTRRRHASSRVALRGHRPPHGVLSTSAPTSTKLTKSRESTLFFSSPKRRRDTRVAG